MKHKSKRAQAQSRRQCGGGEHTRYEHFSYISPSGEMEANAYYYQVCYGNLLTYPRLGNNWEARVSAAMRSWIPVPLFIVIVVSLGITIVISGGCEYSSSSSLIISGTDPNYGWPVATLELLKHATKITHQKRAESRVRQSNIYFSLEVMILIPS